ncbi:MAG TPA: AbrB/MazE/SpoVT family DNA-binding domain-containing protein [Bryobacteraceae bacterium]|nr:AbrB/MazE/SpoVT family DNA-binding domain-containing protein [Bryobacteraceae bacterium]
MQVSKWGNNLAIRIPAAVAEALELTALQEGCDTFYSEDLRDGQVIEGLTIRNLFRNSIPSFQKLH